MTGTQPKAPTTVLIVLSFNAKDDTIACLHSIYRSKPPSADVIVVDNASTDGAVAALRQAFQDIEIVELPENLGWAGGNNAGITLALDRGYELICLMNNDLCVPPGALDTLLGTAATLEPCLLHPAIYYFDQPEVAQLDPSAQARPLPGHDGLYELDYAYGACLLVHADLFRKIGLIDERFFLQLEEADFHCRATKAGFRSLCCTKARILHKESVSFGGRSSPLKTYYIVRNTLLLAEKHDLGSVRYARAIVRLLWSLRRRAGPDLSRAAFALWLLSGDPYAAASRLGFRDYLLRRFGQLRAMTKANL